MAPPTEREKQGWAWAGGSWDAAGVVTRQVLALSSVVLRALSSKRVVFCKL